MVGPANKRRAVKIVVKESLGGTAQACRALGLSRSGYYLVKSESVESRRMRREIIELSRKHSRYGYRRITAMMRREGFVINAKRVQRVRREEGLQVSKKQRRSKRLGTSTAQRQMATHPNHVWSWDFVMDQTESGSCFRILTLLDEFTRVFLTVHVAWSIRAEDVITVVEAAMVRYGRPEHLRSDNGPEFIAHKIQDWLRDRAVKTLYIKPGSPWENGHIESFHDKFRDEHLNRELYGSLLEAKVLVEAWRSEYNQLRPHSSLGYQTPEEFAACWQTPPRPTASAPSASRKMQ
jgi:putative transposase